MPGTSTRQVNKIWEVSYIREEYETAVDENGRDAIHRNTEKLFSDVSQHLIKNIHNCLRNEYWLKTLCSYAKNAYLLEKSK